MSGRRVLYVITGLGVGGAERQAVLLATGMSRRGWAVRVATLVPGGTLEPELQAAGIEVVSLGVRPGRPSPRGLVRLARLYRRFQPAVVHSHMVHANLAARLARLAVSVPRLVCTAHTTIEGGRARDLWYALTDRLADVTTNVSRAGMARYVARGLISPARARYVPNGLDLPPLPASNEARRELRRALGLSDGFTWISVARLVPAKGHLHLLPAFALHRRSHPSSQLLLVGDGPLREALNDAVGAHGLDGAVHFLGTRHDVPALLGAADAFVLASELEGLPMAVLEALAAGLPVVATDVGGVPELVGLSSVSRCVPHGVPPELARAMDEVARIPAEARAAAGHQARSSVAREFGIEAVLDAWEEVYEGAVPAMGGSAP